MTTSTQLDAWAKTHASLHRGNSSVSSLPPHSPTLTMWQKQLLAAVSGTMIPQTCRGLSEWPWWLHIRTYYDSYGLAPDSTDMLLKHCIYFITWLTSIYLRYSWNQADLQELTARTCGHRSLHFCKHGPWSGWGEFGPDRDKNDRRIRELVVLNDQAL